MNPTLISHTHCQAARSPSTIQSLSISVSEPTHGQKKQKYDRTTSCIVHLADSANIKGVTSNKLCGGLTNSCFESPNDTIHVTVGSNAL